MWRTEQATGRKYWDCGNGLIMGPVFIRFLNALRYSTYVAVASVPAIIGADLMMSEHPPLIFIF